MNLEQHYDKLYNASVQKILSGSYELDSLIDAGNDDRLGLTLRIEPDKVVKERIQRLLNEMKEVDPYQYYYPDSDIHVTLLSIISCYSGFDLSKVAIHDYITIMAQCLKRSEPFAITFRGVTASPSCVMIQGFMENNALNLLREELRKRLKHSGLEQSIDKRYSIQTAHSTVVRFRSPLCNTSKLVGILEKYRDFYFGSWEVNSVELVLNDWYHRNGTLKKLHSFML